MILYKKPKQQQFGGLLSSIGGFLGKAGKTVGKGLDKISEMDKEADPLLSAGIKKAGDMFSGMGQDKSNAPGGYNLSQQLEVQEGTNSFGEQRLPDLTSPTLGAPPVDDLNKKKKKQQPQSVNPWLPNY
jgi:hypothetical protein